MSHWPDLAALELLVAVADHGSLAAGARAVEMAQPNASRSMARLERSVGVPLLQRSTRGSTLTPAGLLVTDWARSVVTAARRLVDGAALLGQDASGTLSLRVSASQTVAEHLLPRWLAGVRSAFPDSRVQVTVHNSHDVVQDVLHGTADVGFIESPKPPSGVHRAVVARDELVLVVHPQHPWAARHDPVSTAELAATPLITREAGSGTRMALDEALGRPVEALLEMPSNAAVRVSVQAGSAPAVLSRLAVEDALAAGTLVQVPAVLDLHRELRAVWIGPRRTQGLAAELIAEAQRTGCGSARGRPVAP
ncbi:LysR family transcriptional regulator [Kocuria tytonicola]|uniref:LysR family transcriptional regulator n=1 Tax=Kocuria tytonicola TaxID=2055946 RepID=A0A3L9KZF1_9MICC|nr:LysR family transcriptional regulator [Kocuria tytonicola]RLY91661.1 LysR family transcriptional regulator [Kocuria tytonicola]